MCLSLAQKTASTRDELLENRQDRLEKKNDYVWFQNNQQLHHTLGVDENVKQQFLAAK